MIYLLFKIPRGDSLPNEGSDPEDNSDDKQKNKKKKLDEESNKKKDEPLEKSLEKTWGEWGV